MIFRRERGVIRVSGRDRLKWLQGMVTAELTTIGPGGGCFAAACNRQGKMVGVMVVRICEDHLLLEIEPELADPLRAHFDRHLIMEDVALEVLRWNAYELVGPQAHEIAAVRPTAWWHFVPWKEGIASTDHTLGRGGCTVLVPGEVRIDDEVGDETGRESLRTANGFPRWGVDMGPEELPLEAGLEPLAVSFAKGCYLGQEVILRVKNFSEPPKRLVLLESERPLPTGAAIGGDVGKVTSSAGRIALGYVRKSHRAAGTEVEVGGVRAIVRDLPWHAFAEKPPDKPGSTVGKI